MTRNHFLQMSSLYSVQTTLLEKAIAVPHDEKNESFYFVSYVLKAGLDGVFKDDCSRKYVYVWCHSTNGTVPYPMILLVARISGVGGEETRSGTEKRSSHNCKAVSLRGGQRIIAVFSHSKYFTRSEPEEEMIKKLKT